MQADAILGKEDITDETHKSVIWDDVSGALCRALNSAGAAPSSPVTQILLDYTGPGKALPAPTPAHLGLRQHLSPRRNGHIFIDSQMFV